MPSTPTPRLRIEQQSQGSNLNVWGDPNLNSALQRLEEAVADIQTVAVSGAVTLTSNNYVADQARAAGLVFTGTGGTVTIPSVTKVYKVINKASGAVVIATTSGTAASFQAGETGETVCFDGMNVVKTLSSLIDLTQAFSATSTTANAISTGVLTYTVQTGRAFAVGMGVRISDNAAPITNYMTGTVTAYSGTTLSVNVTATTGSGTPASVTIAFNQAAIGLPSQAGNAGRVLSTDGTSLTWIVATQYQEFTASGTWIKPANATHVYIELHGAAGGGGSGARFNPSSQASGGGSGGAGGSLWAKHYAASDVPASVPVTIGAGGTGAPSITTDTTAGTSGGAGGRTSFGTLLGVNGGGGGGGGLAGGGSTAGATQTALYSGGTGASGATTNPTPAGGSVALAGAGGGAGGAIGAGSVESAAGAGGIELSAGGVGGTAGVLSTAGTGSSAGGIGLIPFAGGGGGGARLTNTGVPAGSGGAGALAAGGGGGGASINGVVSGAGGNGGGGRVRVWSWS